MIPALTHTHEIDSVVALYISSLVEAGFSGDIESSYASRLAVATDNSIYQALPKAVIFPKNTNDLACLIASTQGDAFTSIRFSPRGGGTGTNGQSLTHDIVLDLSRYMREIIEINIEESWVRVQAGVVKDALNDALKPFGYFFAPDLSTSNRATIGGMVNTDASGQGSLRYGKTSDHVLSLTAVLHDGSVLHTEPQSYADIMRNPPDYLAQQISQTIVEICKKNRSEIENKFPPLNRFLTGYDLKNAYHPETDQFDLARIICGSEGTLAIVTEAKLKITPIPKHRVLINVKYDSFDSALRHAPSLVQANALSVETIDSRVLDLAKQDVIWHSVQDLLTDVPEREMLGINMIEFADQDAESIDRDIQELKSALDHAIESQSNGVIGYQVCHDLASIDLIYAMRKKAVGLLGATQGAAKPVAFVEDTCVPPEHLADFITEFRALLDQHKLDYGMFGHVDAGVLHVRPAFDFCDPNQETLMQSISDSVVALVAKYGGLMWGEHGKGYRSEYGPDFFGEQLFTELRKIKAAFDPYNRMNPGKICTPYLSDEALVHVEDTKRGFYDRQIPIQVRESYQQAIECNGNGLCFNYDKDSAMCPSMKISYDRRHSPKGRAGIVREWLRLLAAHGVDPLDVERTVMSQSSTLRQWVAKFQNTWGKERHQYDFSHEVMDTMNACLACKACATQCPIKVDVPRFRARFIQLYHTRYARPLKDHLVSNIETLLPYMAKAPQLINGVTQPLRAKSLTKKMIGYVDTPALSVPTLFESLQGHHSIQFNWQWLRALSPEEAAKYVFIVQDPFTSYYDAEVVRDFVYLIEKMGKKPMILPFKPNGKAQYIKGFLKQFVRTASNTAEFLNQMASLKIPMVGIDPAMVLCYRDEYQDMLGENRGDFQVYTAHEWLLSVIEQIPQQTAQNDEAWYLFAHCTEKTKLPNAEKEWGRIFKHLGQSLQSIPVGCCGMAGTFGHEADKYDQSKAIYELSWTEKIANLPVSRCMATGYSCRSQVKRFERKKLKHPVQVLLSLSLNQ